MMHGVSGLAVALFAFLGWWVLGNWLSPLLLVAVSSVGRLALVVCLF